AHHGTDTRTAIAIARAARRPVTTVPSPRPWPVGPRPVSDTGRGCCGHWFGAGSGLAHTRPGSAVQVARPAEARPGSDTGCGGRERDRHRDRVDPAVVDADELHGPPVVGGRAQRAPEPGVADQELQTPEDGDRRDQGDEREPADRDVTSDVDAVGLERTDVE